MKSFIYKLLTLVVTAAVVTACSSSEAGDKQSQLDKLKAQQADLATQIATIEKEMAAANPDAVSSVKAKEVVTTVLAAKPFNHYVKTQGSVESEENILVSAKSAGVVTQVFAKEGQVVSKGQVLAQIDNTLAMRGIEAMKSQVELAKTTFERQKNLWDQKIGSEIQYLQTKSTKENLEKQLASLEEQNEMTKIKSPVSGVVDALTVKVGENIAPGMPAARVVNNSDLKLVINVSEIYVNQLKQGNKVIVTFPDIKKDVETKVSFVAKNIDALSRTFAVEASLPSIAELRPNMMAVVKIVYASEPAAIVVPINVVQTINGEKIVYVAETNGKQTVARKRVVTINGVFDNQAQVQGLAVGDKIITVGFQGLNDGDFVKI